MKNRFSTAVLAALFSISVHAEIDEAKMADFESTCYKYAKEDGVAQEEMETYISQCVQDLITSESEMSGESAEGDPKE
ncbi:MAG: hypothetical protein B6D71_10295 [gamma proteobacterium symbiont of Stewartia floridana]|nr:MAG: hypothetical protein B6D73_15560 [gamma proteobacterium symbiont of Stewartia floridana]RLW69448.1 MAG: hypothetical protein B6D71_10295 [gamma proteobacterium symbiont of Stewartia floridana]